MKKILFLTIAVFFLSCSSDDEEYTPTKDLTQSKVDCIVEKWRMEEYITSSIYKTCSSDLFSTIGQAYGHGGLYIHYNSKNLYSFDKSCPVEWSPDLQSRLRMTINENDEIIAECKNCGSQFSPVTMKPLSGEALKQNFHLVQYKIELKEGAVYHITNPKYKK